MALDQYGKTPASGHPHHTREVNNIRFRAYRRYDVSGYCAHGVVYIVEDDPAMYLR